MAIAGGVVGNYGSLDQDLVQMVRADLLRGEQDGLSVENRVIQASLKSLKPEERDEVEELFLFLVVFDEDVTVPVEVFDALSPWIAKQSKRRGSGSTTSRSSPRPPRKAIPSATWS